MNERERVAAILRELRDLGVRELFLDGLTAREAAGLLRGGVRHRSVGLRPTRGGSEMPGPAAAVPEPEPAAGGSLTVLRAKASTCTRCRLAEGRRNVVFGRGDERAELVVVGEAPGGEEDRTGQPFVGPAGKLLDLLLLSVGFDRENVYICNVLKCRPPSNRDPMADEVAACSSHLHGQLEAIAPKVLLAVGKFSAQMLTGTEAPIGRLRGQVHAYRGIPVVATYHPAYLLRTPAATRKTWQDLQLMRQVLDEHA